MRIYYLLDMWTFCMREIHWLIRKALAANARTRDLICLWDLLVLKCECVELLHKQLTNADFVFNSNLKCLHGSNVFLMSSVWTLESRWIRARLRCTTTRILASCNFFPVDFERHSFSCERISNGTFQTYEHWAICHLK